MNRLKTAIIMKEFWDQRYSETGFAYGTAPNAYFKEQLDKLSPVGKLLLPAEGEGRNAVYAAGQGWDVTAFDFSPAGKHKALALAETKQVKINYLVGDIAELTFPKQHFDTLALIYAHFSGPDRALYHQKLLQSLKTGGTVIFEAYAKEQLDYQQRYGSGGPKQAAMLFSLQEVQKEFAGLQFAQLQKLEINSREGKYHTGPACVIRFTGTKL